MRVMFTGHRPHVLGASVGWVETEIVRVANKLYDGGLLGVGLSGLALGSDTWWAESVLRLGVELHAYVPFPQQADRWAEKDKSCYETLLSRATKIITIGASPNSRHYHERNALMVRDANICVAAYRPSLSKTGTGSTVHKILAAKKPLVMIDVEQQKTYTKNFPQDLLIRS